MTKDDFSKIKPNIPKLPGVYQFKSDDDTTLYVGKAKKLVNRLSSYFNSQSSLAYRTKTMVKNANHIIFTLVDTEQDALLLENTLIKKLQPRYNVMLKDGKSYSYLCVKKERFPRVILTRRVIKDGSQYYGPYTSRYRIKQLLDLMKQLFQLRTCSYSLSEENIDKQKFKVCLEYHIKNCLGACENLQSHEDYMSNILQIKNILKGHFTPVKDYIKEQMSLSAGNLKYEEAQNWKEKLLIFEDYQSKSTVVSHKVKDVDVFSYVENKESAFVNYLKVINGALINAHTIWLKKNLNEDKSTILYYAIRDFRERFNSIAPVIILEDRIK